MKTRRITTRAALLWLWTHTAAAVALIAILLAFVVGYRLGRPTPTAATSPAESGARGSSEAQLYTCSMHPSVRLADPNAKCPICFMELIPVRSGGADEAGGRSLHLSADAAARSRIETARVARFFPRTEVRLYGKVTYDETVLARITAYFPGRIERLFVNYVGVPVQRGEHLAEIYSPTVLIALEELRQSQAAVQAMDGTNELLRRSTTDTLAAAREKLRLLGLTEAQVAAVEEGSFQSDRLTIFAPIGGVVTHLAVREGDYVDTGAPLATVADLSRLWLDLEAYETNLPLLRWGQSVEFTVEALPGETFEGKISFIEPVVKERTRTAAVRVAVENSDHKLKPGMYASARVQVQVAANGAVVEDALAGRWVSPMHPTVVKDEPGTCDICGMDLVSAESLGVVDDPSKLEEPLVIPRTAVLFTGTRSVVYVATTDSEQLSYEGREVVLGPRAGELYIVREGLREGESVVVNGAFRIDSAMQIAAKPSMMMPEGGAGGMGLHAGHGEQPTPAGAAATSIPEHFLGDLEAIYDAYLSAQESLADDDLGAFLEAHGDLQEALASTREAGLVGESLGAWRRAASALRSDTTPTTIADARSAFERMSEGVIALERRFGHRADETWHLAHCPMAFDFAGADWMQRGTEIDNPYFGASMLRCGDVRAELPPRNAEPAQESAPEHGAHSDD